MWSNLLIEFFVPLSIFLSYSLNSVIYIVLVDYRAKDWEHKILKPMHKNLFKSHKSKESAMLMCLKQNYIWDLDPLQAIGSICEQNMEELLEEIQLRIPALSRIIYHILLSGDIYCSVLTNSLLKMLKTKDSNLK